MDTIKLPPPPEPTVGQRIAGALYAACVYNQVTKIEGPDVDGERHRYAYLVPAYMYEQMVQAKP